MFVCQHCAAASNIADIYYMQCCISAFRWKLLYTHFLSVPAYLIFSKLDVFWRLSSALNKTAFVIFLKCLKQAMFMFFVVFFPDKWPLVMTDCSLQNIRQFWVVWENIINWSSTYWLFHSFQLRLTALRSEWKWLRSMADVNYLLSLMVCFPYNIDKRWWWLCSNYRWLTWWYFHILLSMMHAFPPHLAAIIIQSPLPVSSPAPHQSSTSLSTLVSTLPAPVHSVCNA